MPFKSQRQRRWMHANKPQMAARWEREAKRKGERDVPSKGVRKRVARIKAKGEATGKEALRLARKRDKSYKARVKATGMKGPGKAHSLKRAIWKKGNREDAANLRAMSKMDKKVAKVNARVMGKTTLGKSKASSTRKVEEVRSSARRRVRTNSVSKPSLSRAVKGSSLEQATKNKKVSSDVKAGLTRAKRTNDVARIRKAITEAAGVFPDTGRRGGSGSSGRLVKL